jgi:HNH endonuclease
VKANLRALVLRRARYRCEYCGLPESHAPVTPLHVEHIIARKHGGPTWPTNLAAACHHCNLHKGTDLVGIDNTTGKRTPLFNPRRHKWHVHFRWEGTRLIGKTSIGRTTIIVLAMNDKEMIDLRQALQEEGVFPW